VLLGIYIKKILALRHASDVTNMRCSVLFGSKTNGIGARFGNDQNGVPSLVLASRGYTCRSY
jgi:hypothetical protein